jgi:hypothetical protein
VPGVGKECLVFKHIAKYLDTCAFPLSTAIKMIANDPVQCQAPLIIFCAVIFDIPPKINPAQSHTIQLLLSFSYVLDDIKEKYLGLSCTLNYFHHVPVVIDCET